MKKLIFTFSKRLEIHEIAEWSGKTIGMLGLFLTDTSLRNIPSFIQWAHNQNEVEGGTNSTWLKKNNGYVLIGSLFSDEPNGGPFFEISIDQFVKLLTEWEKLVKAKAQTITITEQDGVITITGE